MCVQKTIVFLLTIFDLSRAGAIYKSCNSSGVRNYCEGLPEVPTQANGLPSQGKFTWDPDCVNATVGSTCKATCDENYKFNKGSYEVSCVVLIEGAEPQWQLTDLNCAFEPLGIYTYWCTAATTIVTFIAWMLIGKCMYDRRKIEHAAALATGVPKRSADDR